MKSVVFTFMAVTTAILLTSGIALAELSNAPDSGTVGANARVWDILRAGDRVYLAGNFTQLTNPDGAPVARNYLAAIDANTGKVVPDWNPNPNGSVRSLALSEDGTRIYVGGTFTDVGGTYRGRLAAINAATGNLDTAWKPGTTNSTVRSLAVSGNGLYAGGDFWTVQGQSRKQLAKLDATTGALTEWDPFVDDGGVRAVAFSEDDGRLYVGGFFHHIDGRQTGTLAALDPATGAVDDVFRPNSDNGILCLAVSGGRVFAGTSDPLEGIEAFDAVSGRLDWRLGYGAHTPAEGDVQAMTVQDGTLYAGGHFDQLHDMIKHRLVAVDAATGVVDSQWNPNVASSSGDLGPWAVEAYGPYVYVGGDFTSISGRTQERFARFTDGPDQPDKGLRGEYFDNSDFTGTQMTRTDPVLDFSWGNFSPPGIGADTFSARWSGQIRPNYSETYTFHTTSDDGVRLWVNGQRIVDNWTDHAPTQNSGQVALTAGKSYDIRMEFYENAGGAAVAKLEWSSPSQARQVVPQGRLTPAVPTGTDTTTPETTITSGPSGTVSSTTASFEFASSEAGSAFQCSLDGAAFGSCSSPKDYTDLADGSHTFEVRATDATGNTDATPASRTWTVDTAQPSDPPHFSDDWTGPDGSGWDTSKWTTDTGSSATVDLQSGQGRMRFENASGARARAIALMSGRSDTEVLMSFRFPSTAAKGYLQIFSRASGNWASGGYPTSGYFVEVANDSTNVGLRRVSSGTLTQLRNAAVGQVTTQKQWVRLRVEGSTIRAKVWTDGAPEPANWEVEATDASFSGAGVLQLRWARASAATDAREVYLDDLTLRDLGP